MRVVMFAVRPSKTMTLPCEYVLVQMTGPYWNVARHECATPKCHPKCRVQDRIIFLRSLRAYARVMVCLRPDPLFQCRWKRGGVHSICPSGGTVIESEVRACPTSRRL